MRRVIYNVTAKCNLHCRHCYAAELQGGVELSTDEALGVVEEVARCFGKDTKLIFSGGEPLLREDVYDLIEHASRLGLRASLATNGTLITEQVAEKLRKSGLTEVSISLDAASPEIHDQIRGQGNFEKALEGLKACRRAGLEILIDPCVFSFNVEQVLELLGLAEELGAKGLRIFHYIPMGRGKHELPSAQLTTDKYSEWLQRLYNEQLRKPNISIYVTQTPQYTLLLAKGVETGSSIASKMYEELKPGCRAGTHTLSIKHNGDVTPCPLWTTALGNLRSQSLREALNSELARKLRDKQRYLKGKCADCIYVDVCGGCRVRAYQATGDYFSEDPLCSEVFYKPRGEEA